MADVLRFFHPVLASRALRARPVRVTVDGQHVVLFRDATGRVGALFDRCPHRFAPLSKGRVRPDGRLACAYHGWHFDVEGRGVSPSQPTLTRCDARPLRAIERYETIWIAEHGTPDEAFPSLQVPEGHRFGGRFSTVFEAPLHVALDNFSEDEHTPWVHSRLGWAEPDARTIAFEAKSFADRTEVSYTARQRDTALRGLVALKKGDLFHNDWVTHFDPVRTLYSIHWTDPVSGARRPGSLHAAIFMVPETPRTTRFQVLLFARFLGPFRVVAPLLARVAVGLVWLEVRDDARFIPTVADTPLDLRGMRLGRFDKPIVHNRRLLRRIYRGELAGGETGETDDAAESVTDTP